MGITVTNVTKVTTKKMRSIIIVLIKTVTSVEEKTENALIFKKDSLLLSSAMNVVSRFTDKTVSTLTKQSCVSDSKSVPSAVKFTSIRRKRSMYAENTDVLTAERKFCRTISVTFNRLEWSSAIFSTRPMK